MAKKNVKSDDSLGDPRAYLKGSGVEAQLQQHGHTVISTDLDPHDAERNQERMGRNEYDSDGNDAVNPESTEDPNS